MVTVKMFKPYYVKTDGNYVRVVLAYQYFAVVIDNDVYQFVPIDDREIRVNRFTKKVENINARFAFQKGKNIIYMSMMDLIALPDFMMHLSLITKPYLKNIPSDPVNVEPSIEIDRLIDDLERRNLMRLIDKALDNRDEKLFDTLVKLL